MPRRTGGSDNELIRLRRDVDRLTRRLDSAERLIALRGLPPPLQCRYRDGVITIIDGGTGQVKATLT